ncbi:MAG: hypothetical protein QM627_04220 [Luteolibacter sp.]
MTEPTKQPILFFAHERGDARIHKRIKAFQDLGKTVIGFTFHRERDRLEPPVTWPNVDLGTTENGKYLRRLWTFAKCVVLLWRKRDLIGDASVVYVVNWDNALLALLGRVFAGRKVPMVLEIADVISIMTRPGPLAKIFRAVERFVLRRTELLVTTSPGFVREYFLPVQKFSGEIFLLENKVYPSAAIPEPLPFGGYPVEQGRPWKIGFFGALRCAESLMLMKALALKLGDKVEFILRGYPSGRITHRFRDLIADVPNLKYGGAYLYPDDLAELYEEIDLNWCFDESDAGGNSDWLLPNRIYEGGCFGVPALAAARTETGRWIESNGLGWVFADPLEKSLAKFLDQLTVAQWEKMKRQCHPREDFCGEPDYVKLVARMEKLSEKWERQGRFSETSGGERS